jgi:hypothetical protein
MKKQNITQWLEWRYPDLFRNFRRFAREHELYCPDNGIHGQDFTLLIKIIKDYFSEFGLNYKSLWLDKAMKKGFAHINILLR